MKKIVIMSISLLMVQHAYSLFSFFGGKKSSQTRNTLQSIPKQPTSAQKKVVQADVLAQERASAATKHVEVFGKPADGMYNNPLAQKKLTFEDQRHQGESSSEPQVSKVGPVKISRAPTFVSVTPPSLSPARVPLAERKSSYLESIKDTKGKGTTVNATIMGDGSKKPVEVNKSTGNTEISMADGSKITEYTVQRPDEHGNKIVEHRTTRTYQDGRVENYNEKGVLVSTTGSSVSAAKTESIYAQPSKEAPALYDAAVQKAQEIPARPSLPEKNTTTPLVVETPSAVSQKQPEPTTYKTPQVSITPPPLPKTAAPSTVPVSYQKSVFTKNADGSHTRDNGDGSTTKIEVDGSSKTTFLNQPNKPTTSIDTNGNAAQIHSNGSKVEFNGLVFASYTPAAKGTSPKIDLKRRESLYEVPTPTKLLDIKIKNMGHITELQEEKKNNKKGIF